MSRTNDPTKFDNLRHRPFLVIQVFTHPERNARTEIKGWQKAVGSQYVTEHPTLVDHVSKNTWMRAEIIIDIIHDRLIKTQLLGNREEIFNNFKKKYAEIINRSKAVWAAAHAVELAKEKLTSRKEQFEETDWNAI
jgi:hypothetical protein